MHLRLKNCCYRTDVFDVCFMLKATLYSTLLYYYMEFDWLTATVLMHMYWLWKKLQVMYGSFWVVFNLVVRSLFQEQLRIMAVIFQKYHKANLYVRNNNTFLSKHDSTRYVNVRYRGTFQLKLIYNNNIQSHSPLTLLLWDMQTHKRTIVRIENSRNTAKPRETITINW